MLHGIIQVSMISLQSNITQNLEHFKSCNTFSSMWLLVGFLLLFVFMYLFCLYQSMGMCIWWTSSLALWISNFRLCSPACQSIVLISQKIFMMKREVFFYLYIDSVRLFLVAMLSVSYKIFKFLHKLNEEHTWVLKG